MHGTKEVVAQGSKGTAYRVDMQTQTRVEYSSLFPTAFVTQPVHPHLENGVACPIFIPIYNDLINPVEHVPSLLPKPRNLIQPLRGRQALAPAALFGRTAAHAAAAEHTPQHIEHGIPLLRYPDAEVH